MKPKLDYTDLLPTVFGMILNPNLGNKNFNKFPV